MEQNQIKYLYYFVIVAFMIFRINVGSRYKLFDDMKNKKNKKLLSTVARRQ